MQLICDFVFVNTQRRFSHDTALPHICMYRLDQAGNVSFPEIILDFNCR